MASYRAVMYTMYIITGNVYPSYSDCITWQIADSYMILNCGIDRLEFDVSIIEPNGNDVAVCSAHGCALKDGDGNIQQNRDTNETIYTAVVRSNINGKWICRHGNSDISTNVSTLDGILPAIYIHIHGEIATANMETFIKILCWSCWKPVDYNAEFFINSVSKDNVRLVNDRCYNSKEECSLETCMCVSRSTAMYGWTYKATHLLFPVLFSCEMRFKDNLTRAVFKKRATIEFNGRDFKTRKTSTNIIVPARRSVSVTGTTDIIPKKNFEDSQTFFTLVLFITISFISVFLTVVLVVVRKKTITRKQCSENMPLLNSGKNIDAVNYFVCTTCRNMTSYAYCLTCFEMKCETCTLEHIKKQDDHKVIQIADIRLPLQGLYCGACKAANPEKICIECKRLLCNTAKCRCEHYQSRFCMPLVVIKPEYRDLQKRSVYASPDNTITLIYTIAITKDKNATRVRGVELLSRFGLAVLDYGNWNITIYTRTIAKEIVTKIINLENEPRAMVRISPQKVAVTYAYQRQIVIVNVSTEEKSYILLDNIGKPYSIAYMDDHFAVEIGEGEDGMIVIVNMEGVEISRIENIESICFFTGNTIRLALDMKKEVIYASTMGRDEVVCIKYQSKEIVWKAKVPSPRSVIVVNANFSENNSTDLDTSVLLCSKESNTIYKLSSNTGIKDVVMDETNNIRSPRYMSYLQTDNECYLAIEMGNASIKVFKAVGVRAALTI